MKNFLRSIFNPHTPASEKKIPDKVFNSASFKEWLYFDVDIFDKELDKDSVAHVVALTHSYIVSRAMENPYIDIRDDLVFLATAHATKSTLLDDPSKINMKALEQLILRKTNTTSNPILNNLRSTHFTLFAKYNFEVMSAFNRSDWASFAQNSQECSAYTFHDFPEPLICLNYGSIRLRAPEGLSDYERTREWNTFGYCCFKAGLEKLAQHARLQLKLAGVENWAYEWR